MLPHDGKAVGELFVRGNTVISGYLRRTRRRPRRRWTRTAGSAPGTSPRIDPKGFLSIQDRTKDLIKSGGEWISSIDLENIAVAHPEGRVLRGDRRAASRNGTSGPVLVVVPKDGRAAEPAGDCTG